MHILPMFWIHLAHDVSTNSNSIFNMIIFYFGISDLRYDPGKSKIVTYLPSCALVMRPVNRDPKYMVGKDAYSLGM